MLSKLHLSWRGIETLWGRWSGDKVAAFGMTVETAPTTAGALTAKCAIGTPTPHNLSLLDFPAFCASLHRRLGGECLGRDRLNYLVCG